MDVTATALSAAQTYDHRFNEFLTRVKKFEDSQELRDKLDALVACVGELQILFVPGKRNVVQFQPLRELATSFLARIDHDLEKFMTRTSRIHDKNKTVGFPQGQVSRGSVPSPWDVEIASSTIGRLNKYIENYLLDARHLVDQSNE